jgi:Cell division protein
MRISTVKLLLKDALKNIKRHSTTSITSIFTVMLTLLVLGLLTLSILNIKPALVSVYSEFEVRVALKEKVEPTDKQSIYKKIKESKVSANITFDNNTSPSGTYIIKVNDPSDIPKVTSQISGLQGINKISEDQIIPMNISSLIKILQVLGEIAFFILIILIFFIIKYTMKLAIYTRIDEINLIQCLGATDWFIRLPFIFEGMVIGFLGALTSIILLYFLYSFAFKQVTYIFGRTDINLINISFVCTTMSWSFILIGIILTTIGSILVVKKHLVV